MPQRGPYVGTMKGRGTDAWLLGWASIGEEKGPEVKTTSWGTLPTYRMVSKWIPIWGPQPGLQATVWGLTEKERRKGTRMMAPPWWFSKLRDSYFAGLMW